MPSASRRRRQRLQRRPRPRQHHLTAGRSPPPDHRSGTPASRSRRSARPSATDSIVPRPASPASDLAAPRHNPRPILQRQPPATHAAAISPCECPATAAGFTPSHCHAAASATITAHNTGCTTSSRSSSPGSAVPRQHLRHRPVHQRLQRRRTLSQPLRERRARLHQLRRHPRPLPTLPGEHERHLAATQPAPPSPVTTFAAGSPAAKAASPLGEPVRIRSQHHRPVLEHRPRAAASQYPASATAAHRSGHPWCKPRQPPRLRPQRRRPPPRHHPRHGVCRPDTPRRTGWGTSLASCRAGFRWGGSSMITCALVPETPNEETPARRGWPFSRPGHLTGQQPDRARRPVHVRRRLIGVQRAAAASRAAAPAPS